MLLLKEPQNELCVFRFETLSTRFWGTSRRQPADASDSRPKVSHTQNLQKLFLFANILRYAEATLAQCLLLLPWQQTFGPHRPHPVLGD